MHHKCNQRISNRWIVVNIRWWLHPERSNGRGQTNLHDDWLIYFLFSLLFFFFFFFFSASPFYFCWEKRKGYSNRDAISLFSYTLTIKVDDDDRRTQKRSRAPSSPFGRERGVNLVSCCNIDAAAAAAAFIIKSCYTTHCIQNCKIVKIDRSHHYTSPHQLATATTTTATTFEIKQTVFLFTTWMWWLCDDEALESPAPLFHHPLQHHSSSSSSSRHVSNKSRPV